MSTSSVLAQIDGSSPENNTEMVDNFILNDAVKMYPNPVENILFIKSSIPLTRVQVYSLLGDMVMEVSSNFSRINMRHLNSGIYMIKIYSDKFSVTKKLIKK